MTVNERNFHWLMGALLLGSCFVDSLMRDALPTWNPPEASLVTMVIGLVWVGRFAAWRNARVGDDLRVLRDRIERLEQRTGAIDDDLRAHLRRPL
jgi:hypothetical protein